MSRSLAWSCPYLPSVGKLLDLFAAAGATSAHASNVQRRPQCMHSLSIAMACSTESSLQPACTQHGSARQLDLHSQNGMRSGYLHTPSIEADLLTNLPALLQAQLSAFSHPSFLSISTATLQCQHAFHACVEGAAYGLERSHSLQPLLMSLGKMCLLQVHSGFKHIG